MHVRQVERGEVVVGERGPFATEGVVGRELATRLRIPHLTRHVPLRDLLGHSVERLETAVLQHAGHHDRLKDARADAARHSLRERQARVERLNALRHRAVRLRCHPNGSALEHGELGQLRGDLGDELDGCGTGADDGGSATLEVEVVVPLRGVHDCSVKRFDARDVRHLRLRQEAGRGEQVARRERLAVVQVDDPMALLVVPARTVDDDAEAHVATQVILCRDVVAVLLQLAARGVEAGPVRVGLEGVGVGGRRDVDGQAGVAVDVPGAAEVVFAVEDDDVVDVQPAKSDGGAHAAEPSADDDGVVDVAVDLGGHGCS